ncbi:cytochrome P450 [Plantactinospora endophytica]|uniref:Cytochrome P450 n=1 Tax=Plantactinospora endophytica TaxID=673535 RepID=A0ABQ4E1U7_9ACTN|nr:cytochrome P450 [Plantactinospora endophytica]GIG88689.1 cytochrome P450 [Plantactinospora endophytica]
MTASPTLPLKRTCPYAPPAEHVALQRQERVTRVRLPDGSSAWALSRLDDIRTMLTDPRFSSDRRREGYPLQTPGPPRRATERPTLIGLDPPEHGAARRAVVGEFTIKQMNALRPRIQQIVDERVDAMLAGPRPADLVSALALPVPSLVICELLGVPYAEHDFFQDRSARLLLRSVPPQERFAAANDIREYMATLIAEKAKNPAEDLLSRQLAKGADQEELAGLGFLLLLAGHETTGNMISLGTMTLLERPEALAGLKADPTVTPQVVEELLRYFTIAEYVTSRIAVADVELGGVLIRAGEGVITLANVANRDPAAFTDGDTFDIGRAARHHVAFGFGAHQCLGQNLARVELQIVFDTLFGRIPELRLAVTADELSFKDDSDVYGLHSLPVTW